MLQSLVSISPPDVKSLNMLTVADIMWAAGRMGLMSTEGIPMLTPELVLLFKSKNTSGKDRSKDQADFEQIYPLPEAERRAWLHWALVATDPSHPWIEQLT